MLQNLKEFFAEAKSEFKKISWPSREEARGSTAVVLITVVFLVALFAVYDLSVTHLLKLVIK
jgi:preprotein translocase subunit SecE